MLKQIKRLLWGANNYVTIKLSKSMSSQPADVYADSWLDFRAEQYWEGEENKVLLHYENLELRSE